MPGTSAPGGCSWTATPAAPSARPGELLSILIDPPQVARHGRLWSHLASDTSYDELHAFARELGVPVRGFDHDHYDVPSEWYDKVLAAGAEPVTSRELVTRITAAGLRRRKRPGDRRA